MSLQRDNSMGVMARLLLLLAVNWISVRECYAQTVQWQSIDGLQIGVNIRANAHAAMSPELIDLVFRRTEELFTILLGSQAQLSRETCPNLNHWLADHALEELTAEQCIEFGVTQFPKELIIDLRYHRGEYQIALVEFDRVLRSLSLVQSERTPQRQMVADIAANLAMKIWSPVGEIVGRDGKTFEIRLDDQQRLVDSSEWTGLRPGAILQLFSESVDQKGHISRSSRQDQFLIVESVTPQEITARLAIETQGRDPWFQNLGHPLARYLVRRVSNDRRPTNVRVTLNETNLPREGCYVYVSPSPPQPPENLGEWIGSTTMAGRLPEDLQVEGLNYLTVAYEDRTETRVVVAGVTPSPLPFSFQYRGAQTACQLKVDRLKFELSDTSTILNLRLKEVEAADQALDVDKAEEAARAAQESKDAIEAIRVRAVELRDDPDQCHQTARAELQKLIDDADRLLGRYRGVGDSVAMIQTKLMQTEIDAAWRSHQWQESHRLLREYLELKRSIRESDANAHNRFDELDAALAVSDPDHLSARETVEQSVGIQTYADLSQRWPGIHAALESLVKQRDHFWLRKIYGEFQSWNMILATERRRQDTLRQSQTLGLEQKEELLEEMKRSDQLTEEFREIIRPVASVIQNADDRMKAQSR